MTSDRINTAKERDDLVARLLGADEYAPLGHDAWEAAEQIQQATQALDARDAEIERLRAALEDIGEGEPEWPENPQKELDWCRDRARAALNPEASDA